jgi:ABC-type transport system involved in cytochrome bd biosynthesis fused ATPase/permease subunit
MTDELKSRPQENPYIEFRHVYKAFDEQAVLEDVTFDVRRGEMVAILGRSGVGKSVVLKHIMGFLKPDAGNVFVAGLEVSALSEDELMDVRRRVNPARFSIPSRSAKTLPTLCASGPCAGWPCAGWPCAGWR